jgi:hypothetical protein
MRSTLLLLALSLAPGCGDSDRRGSGGYDVRTPDGRPLDVRHSWEKFTLVARTRGTGAVREIAQVQTVAGFTNDEPGQVAETEDLELWCRAFRPLLLPIPAPREPLTLRPGIPVTIRVESTAPLPSAGRELQLEFQWRGSGELPEAPLLHEFEGAAPEGWSPVERQEAGALVIAVTAEHPAASVRFAFPGPYRVKWGMYAVTRSPGQYSGHGIESPASGDNIVVRDGVEEPQVFTLRIPAAQLNQAQDEVR